MPFPDIASTIETEADRSVLTAPLAIRLAEEALNAGQVDNAICYVNMAYAIFDANADRYSRQLNAWRSNAGQT